MKKGVFMKLFLGSVALSSFLCCSSFFNNGLAFETHEQTTVTASVQPYAEISCWRSGPMNFGEFNGTAEESRKSDNVDCDLETNTGVNVVFSGGDLTCITDPSSKIATAYQVNFTTDTQTWHEFWFNRDGNYTPVSESASQFVPGPNNSTMWQIWGYAKLGNISDQRAGNYTATMTFTVYAESSM